VACAQTVSPTPEPTITATPTPAPSESPTPTPEPLYSIGIQAINSSTALKQATIVIDNIPESTGFSGTADFKCHAGLHELQIYYNNINYYNGSLVVTEPKIFKIDITEYLPQQTASPVEVDDYAETDGTYTGVVLVIIAITGTCLTVILFKRRQE
jgi:hypothetical protein